ncbi:MAG: hypothetical protein KBF83_12630 [Pyrinomonadaceae bacterium]|nr:hypothetical protein [Pyrinomonadaceae bacterium]
MKQLLIISLATAILGSCGVGSIDKGVSQGVSASPTAVGPRQHISQADGDPESYNLRGSLGLLRTSDINSKVPPSVNFFNHDKSPWYEFRFGEGNVEPGNDSLETIRFRPFRFSSADGYLVLNVVGERDGYFEVVTNEEEGVTKLVRANDPLLRRETWEKYILECFAVKFDQRNNSIRTEPNGSILTIPNLKAIDYHPEEIKGDWLKVRWLNENEPKRQNQFGWIRWRLDNRLLISLFETA